MSLLSVSVLLLMTFVSYLSCPVYQVAATRYQLHITLDKPDTCNLEFFKRTCHPGVPYSSALQDHISDNQIYTQIHDQFGAHYKFANFVFGHKFSIRIRRRVFIAKKRDQTGLGRVVDGELVPISKVTPYILICESS